jgi:hypothetical protein
LQKPSKTCVFCDQQGPAFRFRSKTVVFSDEGPSDPRRTPVGGPPGVRRRCDGGPSGVRRTPDAPPTEVRRALVGQNRRFRTKPEGGTLLVAENTGFAWFLGRCESGFPSGIFWKGDWNRNRDWFLKIPQWKQHDTIKAIDKKKQRDTNKTKSKRDDANERKHWEQKQKTLLQVLSEVVSGENASIQIQKAEPKSREWPILRDQCHRLSYKQNRTVHQHPTGIGWSAHTCIRIQLSCLDLLTHHPRHNPSCGSRTVEGTFSE